MDVENCDIIEFGAVIDDLNNQLPLDQLQTFHCYFVKNFYQGEPYALSMHKEIFERIDAREPGYNYYTATRFGNIFKKFLIENGFETEKDRVTINVAGKNFGSCDLQFLNAKTDLSKHVKIRHKFLDPAMLFIEKGDESLPGLSGCKERAGMSSHIAHDGLTDAFDTLATVRYGLRHIYG